MCSLLAALALAAPAAAQGTASAPVTDDQYSDIRLGNGGGDPSTEGALPFTGLEVGRMGGAAAALLGAGIFLRRSARAEDR